jgi:hypothetical protein
MQCSPLRRELTPPTCLVHEMARLRHLNSLTEIKAIMCFVLSV